MRKSQRRAGQALDWQQVHAGLAQSAVAMREALSPSPERATLLLQQRARRLAEPLAAARPSGAMLEVLAFRLAGERYAIETRFVREVVRSAGVTPLPGLPDVVAGLGNLRGEILVVFDIRSLFGLTPQEPTDASRLVVLGDDEPDLGIMVDAVIDVMSFSGSDLQRHAMSIDATNETLVRGVARDALIMLEGAALMSDQRLFISGQSRQ